MLVHEMADDLDAYLAARPGTGVRSLAAAVDFNREHRGLELAHFGQEYLEAALASGGRASDAYRQARERNVAFARDACLGPAFARGWTSSSPPRTSRPGSRTSSTATRCPAAARTAPRRRSWAGRSSRSRWAPSTACRSGFSIVGQAGTEPLLLAIGHALEQALGLAGSPALRPAWRAPMRG